MTHDDLIDEALLSEALSTRAERERGDDVGAQALLDGMRRDVRGRRTRRRVIAGAGAVTAVGVAVALLLPGALHRAEPVPPAAPTQTSTQEEPLGRALTPIEEILRLPKGPMPQVLVPYVTTPFDFTGRGVLRLPDGRNVRMSGDLPFLRETFTDARGTVGVAGKVDVGMPASPTARSRLVAIDPASTTPRPLTTGIVRGVALSPDGAQVAVLMASARKQDVNHLRILDRSTGAVVRDLPMGYNGSALIGWTRSGLVVQRASTVPGDEEFPTSDEPAQVLSPTGTTLRTLPPVSPIGLAVSPTLDRLVYRPTDVPGSNELRSVDLATGKTASTTALGNELIVTQDGKRVVVGDRVLDAATLQVVARMPVEVPDGYRRLWAWDTGYLAAIMTEPEKTVWYACSWSGTPECHRLPKDFPPAG